MIMDNNSNAPEPPPISKEYIPEYNEYVLELLEIEGKNITKNLISKLKNEFDKNELKYEFNLIDDLDEAEYESIIPNISGGSNSTYPYKIFETTVDTIVNNINGSFIKSKLLESRKGLFENYLTPKTNDVVNQTIQPIISEKTIEPIIENNVPISTAIEINNNTNNINKQEENIDNITLPLNYTGIVKLHLLLENKKEPIHRIDGLCELRKYLRRIEE